jgi:hypothetical protein
MTPCLACPPSRPCRPASPRCRSRPTLAGQASPRSRSRDDCATSGQRLATSVTTARAVGWAVKPAHSTLASSLPSIGSKICQWSIAITAKRMVIFLSPRTAPKSPNRNNPRQSSPVGRQPGAQNDLAAEALDEIGDNMAKRAMPCCPARGPHAHRAYDMDRGR